MAMRIEDIISNIESRTFELIDADDFETFVDVAQDCIEDIFIDDEIGGNVQALLIQALDRSSSIDDFMYIVHGDKFAADFQMQTKFDDKERAEK